MVPMPWGDGRALMGSNTPLIIMMCGLGNNSLSFQNKTHMEETACPRGYAVCYVQPGQGTGGRGWDCGIVDPAEVDSLEYIVNLVEETRKNDMFSMGASPRGSIAFMEASKAMAIMNGRAYVTPDDVKTVAFKVLRHRIALSFQALASNIESEVIIDAIMKVIPTP